MLMASGEHAKREKYSLTALQPLDFFHYQQSDSTKFRFPVFGARIGSPDCQTTAPETAVTASAGHQYRYITLRTQTQYISRRTYTIYLIHDNRLDCHRRKIMVTTSVNMARICCLTASSIFTQYNTTTAYPVQWSYSSNSTQPVASCAPRTPIHISLYFGGSTNHRRNNIPEQFEYGFFVQG